MSYYINTGKIWRSDARIDGYNIFETPEIAIEKCILGHKKMCNALMDELRKHLAEIKKIPNYLIEDEDKPELIPEADIPALNSNIAYTSYRHVGYAQTPSHNNETPNPDIR